MFRLGKPPKRRKSSGEGLWVALDRKSERSWKLFGELDERAQKLRAMVPYVAAQETYHGLMSSIPAAPNWKKYRNILRVVRVGPKEWKGGVFAVYGKPKTEDGGAAGSDADRTLIYVHVKKNRLTPPSAVTRILARFSPWTVGLLPVVPKRSEAVVVSRKVSRREVQKVAALRNEDEREWKGLLQKEGVRSLRREPTEKLKFVQDVAFEALRLEFGYGGVKAVPHWRPSVRAAVQVVKRLWKRRSWLTRSVLSPNERAWKKWPPKDIGWARIADLKSMAKFQKRLRVRV